MKLTTHQEKLVNLISRKSGMKPDEYLIQLLLREYKSLFKKEYPIG